MDLYLVRAQLTRTPYMGDPVTTEIIRLVRAASDEAAGRTLKSHCESYSQEYGTSYAITIIESTGVIQ